MARPGSDFFPLPAECDCADLTLALQIALEAGEVIARHYRGEIVVEHKAGDEPVTAADRAANDLIVARLAAARPADAALTEEAGFAAPPAWNGRRLWVVDPLDGTREYIARNGEFAVQIALVDPAPPEPATSSPTMGDRAALPPRRRSETPVVPCPGVPSQAPATATARTVVDARDGSAPSAAPDVTGGQPRLAAGRPVVAVVHAPALPDATWVARRGHGTWQHTAAHGWQRRIIPPMAAGEPCRLAISRSHPSRAASMLADALDLAAPIPHGSVGLKLALLITGRAHLYVNDSNTTKAWDAAAPELILTEAGGIITDLRGDPLPINPTSPRHCHGLLATSHPALQRQALAAIASHFPRTGP